MKKFILAAIFVHLLHFCVLAQSHTADPQLKEKISALSFLVGDWQGKGWVMKHTGEKLYFDQTEKVQLKVDNTALLVEGIGKSDGKTVHNAMAVIRAKEKPGDYSFHSFLFSGQSGSFRAELIDGKLYWYPGENMRYIISINDKKQWHEVGEMQKDNRWMPFFEMTLDKVGNTDQ